MVPRENPLCDTKWEGSNQPKQELDLYFYSEGSSTPRNVARENETVLLQRSEHDEVDTDLRFSSPRYVVRNPSCIILILQSHEQQ